MGCVLCTSLLKKRFSLEVSLRASRTCGIGPGRPLQQPAPSTRRSHHERRRLIAGKETPR